MSVNSTSDIEKIEKISLLNGAYRPCRKFLFISIFGILLGFFFIIAFVILIADADGWVLVLVFIGAFILIASVQTLNRFVSPNRAYKNVKEKMKANDIDGLLNQAKYSVNASLLDNAIMLFSLYGLIDMTRTEVIPILLEHHIYAQKDPKKMREFIQPMHILSRKLGYASYLDLLARYGQE